MGASMLGPISELVVRGNEAYLAAAGWRPEIIPYGGYGSTQVARVLCRTLMSGRPAGQEPSAPHRGWQQFVVGEIPRQPVLVRLGEAIRIVYADRGGFVDAEIRGHRLPAGWHQARVYPINRRDLRRHREELLGHRGWTSLPVETLIARARRLKIRIASPALMPVRIVGADETVGIVSDIDDTVMVSDVPRPVSAAKHALLDLLDAREPVPGMADFLHELQDAGATVEEQASGQRPKLAPPVFYLSTGAWNVEPGLRRFLRREGFPRGTILLRSWWFTDRGFVGSGKEFKLEELHRLTEILPHVRWILVGDNGQHDPETYATFISQKARHAGAVALRLLSLQERKNRKSPGGVARRLPIHLLPEDMPTAEAADGHRLRQLVSHPDFHERLRNRIHKLRTES